jgi:hypothetical protein
MKKCSYCGRENAETVIACSECGTEFEASGVSAVDPVLVDPALSLVIVATFGNVVDATMVKTRLEAAGIEACIPEEYTPQIFWYVVTSPLEQVTVRVAAKDYEEAKAILAAGA